MLLILFVHNFFNKLNQKYMLKLLIILLFSSLLSNCANLCFLPREPGRCSSFFPRYYYNSKKSKCETFIYTGCDGNGNNFKTLAECSQTCEDDFVDIFNFKDKTSILERNKITHINKEKEEASKSNIISHMNAFEVRQLGEMKHFQNPNNISNKEPNEICLLKPETGPCKALFRKFYFDSEQKKCSKFIYGGCQGNSNSFNSVEECELACGGN